MTKVLVTHADEPIGRRVVKTLFHDPSVATILATGLPMNPRLASETMAISPVLSFTVTPLG